MAKKNSSKIDLKDIQGRLNEAFKKTGAYLETMGKEAKVLAKRGENEFVKVSKMGKAQIEILSLSIKKEQLYRQIGKRVWELSTKGKLTTEKLDSFCKDLAEINKKVRSKKKTIDKTLGTKK